MLGGPSGGRDRGVDRLDCDRALFGEAEIAELGEDDAGVFAGDVAEDQVAAGIGAPRLGRWTTLITDAFRSSAARTRSASAGGATIRRWIICGS